MCVCTIVHEELSKGVSITLPRVIECRDETVGMAFYDVDIDIMMGWS